MRAPGHRLEAGLLRDALPHRDARVGELPVQPVPPQDREREPRSMREALLQGEKWLPAIREEIEGLRAKGVWERVPLSRVPAGLSLKRYIALFSLKRNLRPFSNFFCYFFITFEHFGTLLNTCEHC